MLTRSRWELRVEEKPGTEPSLFGAAKRYPLLVVASTVLFAVMAFGSTRLIFNNWVAEVSILIDDPGSSQVFETSISEPERYLASQIAIIESADFAERVRSMINSDSRLSTGEVLTGRSVSSRSSANVIVVSFAAEDPDIAVTYANAFGETYAQYRDDVTVNAFAAAIDSLDDSIAEIDQQIATIDERLAALHAVENGSELEEALQDAIADYLSSAPNGASTPALENVLNQLQTLQFIRSLEAQNPAQILLLDTRRDNQERRSQLVIRRDQLEVDAVLASSGIVAMSEATGAARSPGTTRVVSIGAVLGLFVGLALAYYLAIRNRRFVDRTEPELLLRLPLLADIPRFGNTTPESRIPIINDPTSPAAEAFRFASNAIIARLGQLGYGEQSSRHTIVVTSALVGDGKTTVTINTGLAISSRGKSVLLIDADFGDPALSRLLMREDASRHGITNVVAGDATLGDAVVSIDLGTARHVDVLTRGTIQIPGGDFFNSSGARQFFDLLRTKYDFVIIDAPPLLQVSYSTDVASLADAAVVVIPHEGRVSLERDVMNRLELIAANNLGYVYNKAPRRPELHDRRGSMSDPLGSG